MTGSKGTATSSMLAKLSRPRLYDAVPRERLFLELDSLRRHPLVWVAAPPGAGKTTLVASWLESRHIPGIWYQVDLGDADMATFVYYLGLAARPWQRKHRPLPLLAPEYLGDLPGFARRWFRELFARLGPGHALVLDNLNELPAGSPLLDALAAVAEEVPDGGQMIAISRQEPGVPFVRLAANRTLGMVDGGMLRLTREETAAIAAIRIQVDAARARQLHDLSAGWAGLSLIVERIRRGLTDVAAVGPDPLQDVFDYFAGQIHDRTSPDKQRILLKLSFFPRLTPELAVAATGEDQARDLLEYLYRRHLFVERRTGDAAAASEPEYRTDKTPARPLGLPSPSSPRRRKAVPVQSKAKKSGGAGPRLQPRAPRSRAPPPLHLKTGLALAAIRCVSPLVRSRSPAEASSRPLQQGSARRIGLLGAGASLHRGGMGWTFLKLAGLVVPMFRELAEMRYL